jgi:hypothetical protein
MYRIPAKKYRVLQTALSVTLAGILATTIGVSSAQASGTSTGGGNTTGTGEYDYDGKPITVTCVNGQITYNGSALSYPNFPGCDGNGPSPWSSQSYVFCTTDFVLFRFYGTLADPAGSVTASLVTLPVSDFGCGLKNVSKINRKEFFEQDGSSGLFFKMPASPVDASGAAGSGSLAPWMIAKSGETNQLVNWYNKVGKAGQQPENIYRIPSEFNQGKGLATNGWPFYRDGERCNKFSSPAVHQGTGSEALGKDRVFGTVTRSGNVSYNSKQSYFTELNNWMKNYTAKGIINSSNPQLNARLLGLSGNKGLLSDATLSSADYVACGTPLNFQLKFDDRDVISRDADGFATKVRMPAYSRVPVNAVAYTAITRIGNKGKPIIRNSLAVEDNIGMRTTDSFSRAWTPAFVNDIETCGLDKFANEAGRVKCQSATLNTFYGNNITKDVLKPAYVAALKKFYRSPSNYASLGLLTEVRNSDDPTQLYPYNVDFIVDGTVIEVMTSSYSLTQKLLPPTCVPGTEGCPTQDIPPPTPTQPIVPETKPDVPNNPVQPADPGAGFLWRVWANTPNYLEVRTDRDAGNRIPFTIEVLREWKSQSAAEAFIDAIAVPAMRNEYNNALAAWRNFAQVGGKPNGLAAAELTYTKESDYSGRDWDLKASWEGMDMLTYVPQCNSGNVGGACPPRGTPWNTSALTNPLCTTPGCFTPESSQNNAGNGVAMSPTGTVAFPNYSVGGRTGIGAWSYDFYTATGKGKSVTVAHQSATPQPDTFRTETETRPHTYRNETRQDGFSYWQCNGRNEFVGNESYVCVAAYVKVDTGSATKYWWANGGRGGWLCPAGWWISGTTCFTNTSVPAQYCQRPVYQWREDTCSAPKYVTVSVRNGPPAGFTDNGSAYVRNYQVKNDPVAPKVDVNVRYDANNPAANTWKVEGRYKTWDPVYGPWYDVIGTKVEWVQFVPKRYHSNGEEQTYPVDKPYVIGQTRDIIDYVPSGWKGWGKAGNYLQYTLGNDQSVVGMFNGRAISGAQGAAGCARGLPFSWNYCSPVLAGKVNN